MEHMISENLPVTQSEKKHLTGFRRPLYEIECGCEGLDTCTLWNSSKPESLQIPYSALLGLLFLGWGGAVWERLVLLLSVLCYSGELLENYIFKQEWTMTQTKSIWWSGSTEFWQLYCIVLDLKSMLKPALVEDRAILPEIRVGVCTPGVMWLHCADTHCRRWVSLMVLTQERLGDNLKSWLYLSCDKAL